MTGHYASSHDEYLRLAGKWDLGNLLLFNGILLWGGACSLFASCLVLTDTPWARGWETIKCATRTEPVTLFGKIKPLLMNLFLGRVMKEGWEK